jgi:carboxypeptidase C (cathepsin A)
LTSAISAHVSLCRLFYVVFESRRHTKEDPVVIWLTGGPGCSSELALFYENGPFQIADDLSLVWNEFGWDQVTSTQDTSVLINRHDIFLRLCRCCLLIPL